MTDLSMTTGEAVESIFRLVELILIPVLYIIFRKLEALEERMVDLRDEFRSRTSKIEIVLMGPEGSNGLRGDVKTLISDLKNIDHRLIDIERKAEFL